MNIGKLNGERSRASAEQEEPPEKYRWAKEQARDLLEARNIPPEAVDVEKFLSSCSMPDVHGGWKPIAISNYLERQWYCVPWQKKTPTLAVFFVVVLIVMFLSYLSSANIFANLTASNRVVTAK